jgi:hypothetical protein
VGTLLVVSIMRVILPNPLLNLRRSLLLLLLLLLLLNKPQLRSCTSGVRASTTTTSSSSSSGGGWSWPLQCCQLRACLLQLGSGPGALHFHPQQRHVTHMTCYCTRQRSITTTTTSSSNRSTPCCSC